VIDDSEEKDVAIDSETDPEPLMEVVDDGLIVADIVCELVYDCRVVDEIVIELVSDKWAVDDNELATVEECETDTDPVCVKDTEPEPVTEPALVNELIDEYDLEIELDTLLDRLYVLLALVTPDGVLVCKVEELLEESTDFDPVIELLGVRDLELLTVRYPELL